MEIKWVYPCSGCEKHMNECTCPPIKIEVLEAFKGVGGDHDLIANTLNAESEFLVAPF